MIGVLNYQAPPSSSRRFPTNNNPNTNATTTNTANTNIVPPSNASVDSRESEKDSNILIQEESKLMYIMLISFRSV